MAARKKKSARPTRKPARSKARANKRKPAKKAARRPSARSLAPRPVKTGSGPGPLEVAGQVVALLRQGKAGEVEAKWMAPGVTSTEGVGVAMTWTGKKAVLGKYRDWEADHEIHAMQIEGPWVGATGFAVRFAIDVTQKSSGTRSQMEEIAVYTVRNGKITAEEFHFRTF